MAGELLLILARNIVDPRVNINYGCRPGDLHSLSQPGLFSNATSE